MNVRQNEEDTLREFIQKYKKAVAPIKNLKIQEAVRYFFRNINIKRHKDFANALISRAPQTLSKVYKIAQEHVSIDEALRALNPKDDSKRDKDLKGSSMPRLSSPSKTRSV